MKTVIAVGKTMSVISLNKIGGYIREKDPTILVIDSAEKEAELNELVNAGLIEISNKESEPPKPPEPLKPPENSNKKTLQETPKKVGRPKGSKGKIQKASTKEESKEAIENQMGNRVVIGTGSGTKEGRMKYSAIDDIPENERTKASLDAMEKLEEEEKTGRSKVETIIDESKLDASEQMGRKATISNQGQAESVEMKNSILPHSKDIKDGDPFIDESEAPAEDEAAFIDKSEENENKDADDDFLQL